MSVIILFDARTSEPNSLPPHLPHFSGRRWAVSADLLVGRAAVAGPRAAPVSGLASGPGICLGLGRLFPLFLLPPCGLFGRRAARVLVMGKALPHLARFDLHLDGQGCHARREFSQLAYDVVLGPAALYLLG